MLNEIKFYDAVSNSWLPNGLEEADKQKNDKSELNSKLKTALQMPNIMVLAGSGTSLGNVNGPSMTDLWNYCTQNHTFSLALRY